MQQSADIFLHEYYDNSSERELLSLCSEVFDRVRQIEKLIRQPKELVNQKTDRNEWKRRRDLLILF